ncbi:MAG: hypothetical protein WCH39_21720, partial [Schlesneria sp.]
MSMSVQCSDAKGIVAERNRICRVLPPDLQKKFGAIFTAYLVKYGIDGIYERFAGRTVKTIFEEFNEADAPTPIESGTVGGMRFTLYDPPAKSAKNTEIPPDANAETTNGSLNEP